MAQSLRLLLVEDSEDDALLMLEMLRRGGFAPESRRVETEADFRAALAEESWDVCITDAMLPRFNGMVAIRIARQLAPDMPVIMVSGKIGEETAVEAMRAGARDYLLKDQLARLLPAIERELQEAKTRHEHRIADTMRAQWASIVASSDEAIIGKTLDGIITSWNPAAERLYGYTAQEATGQSLNIIIPPEHRGELEHILAHIRSGEQVERYETERRAKDGTLVEVSVTVSPIRDENGRVVGASTLAHDISERKRSEEALRESEARFRSLFEDSHAVMLIIDPENARIVDANRAAIQYYGYPRETLLNMAMTEINMLPSDELAGEMSKAFQNLTRTFYFRHRLADGSLHDVEVYSGPVYYSGKQLLYSIIFDITERKRAEAERERVLAELTATLNAIPAGLVIYNMEGQIVRLNEVAAQMMQYPQEELDLTFAERMTRGIFRIKTPDGHELPMEKYPVIRALHGEMVSNEVMQFILHGRTFWVSVSAAAIRVLEQRLIGVVMTFADIQKLHALQEQQEDLLHTISHDLRTPLTVISGHTQLLREGLLDHVPTPQEQESLSAIARSVQRLQSMIRDLVDATRLEGAQLQLQLQPVDLAAFLNDLLKRTATVLETDRIRMELPANLPLVLADFDRLERIFINLLSNALKYSAPGTPVLIRARQMESMVEIAVIDQGEGISPEDLPHLFERFYRSRRKKGGVEGIGLGLYITRQLIEAHGGQIGMESTVGQGSRFTFTLPIVDE